MSDPNIPNPPEFRMSVLDTDSDLYGGPGVSHNHSPHNRLPPIQQQTTSNPHTLSPPALPLDSELARVANKAAPSDDDARTAADKTSCAVRLGIVWAVVATGIGMVLAVLFGWQGCSRVRVWLLCNGCSLAVVALTMAVVLLYTLCKPRRDGHVLCVCLSCAAVLLLLLLPTGAFVTVSITSSANSTVAVADCSQPRQLAHHSLAIDAVLLAVVAGTLVIVTCKKSS